MQALLDMTVSPTLVDILRQHGHDGVHAYPLGLGRAPDTELLLYARQAQHIVITADLDFPRLLAFSAADGPGLILFRGGNYSDAEMRQLLTRVLETVPPETLERSVCVVDRSRIRITRLPLRGDLPAPH